MKEIIPNNKGKKKTTSQHYAKGVTAALQHERLIHGSQKPLGNSTCQLGFITFRSPFWSGHGGIVLTISPSKHRWVRRENFSLKSAIKNIVQGLSLCKRCADTKQAGQAAFPNQSRCGCTVFSRSCCYSPKLPLLDTRSWRVTKIKRKASKIGSGVVRLSFN